MAYAKRLSPSGEGGMADLIDKALKQMSKKLKPNTIKQYEAAAARLKEYLAECQPREVLPRHVAALKNHMEHTPNMANRVISFLRMVFAYALEQQLVDSNRCTGIRLHIEKKRDRYITDGEFQAICAVASENMRVVYEMCYLTGQRIGDVLAIPWRTSVRKELPSLSRKPGRGWW